MKIALDIVAAWFTLDIVLVTAWHLAHVRSRSFGNNVVSLRSGTQRVYALAAEAPLRDTGRAFAPARRG